jgi:hypothetical protein
MVPDETIRDVVHQVLGFRPASKVFNESRYSSTTNPDGSKILFKERPCVIVKAGEKPSICLMATFEGTDFSQLSEVLREISVPVYPLSPDLSPSVAIDHIHSTPDMKEPAVVSADYNKVHWQYLVVHIFPYTGPLHLPKGDLAERRFSAQEVQKILKLAVARNLVLTSRALKNPEYFTKLWQGYQVCC